MVGEASLDVLARLIGVSEPTLHKHFADEIQFGRARVLADQLSRLDKASRKGNVAAAKALAARKDQLPQKAIAPEGKPAPKLGKKEQALANAETAERDTNWSDLIH